MTSYAWERYKNDFNNLTDEEIEWELNRAIETIEENEEWVEAVESWKAAGKPRSVK